MRIRKGKDIAIRWRIFTNGNSEPLEGRQLLLELKSPFGRVFELPFSISEGNVIETVFRGVDQQNVGYYSLTLWENKGYDGQTAVDAVRAFELVRTTDEEDKVGCDNDLTTETIDLGISDITLTGLTVRDLFGGGELFDLTGEEFFAIKVGDELRTISSATIVWLLGTGGTGGTVGTTDYAKLRNKPQIGDVVLEGNKTAEELGLQPKGEYPSVEDVNEALNALAEQIPTDYLTEEDLEGYAKTSDIPSVQGLATIEYVNKAINVSIVEQTNSVVTILPNVLNVWGEVASLDITLADGEEGVVNEYMVQFTSGATATTLTLPDSIVWMSAPSIQANKTYQLSIINNLGVIGEFSHE